MENKQTAVNWIESKLNSVKPTDFCSIETIRDWINQAKAMEKEQIKDAYRVGRIDGNIPFEFNHTFEKYYEETYGTKQK